MRKHHLMKRQLSTVIHSLFALAIVACGGSARERTQSTGADSTAFKVALLTPGPISDQAWNAGAYRGLTRIGDSLAAKTSHIQTKTPAEIEENFRQYGAHGYDLVFGHGFEFQDAALRVAPSYPKTVYVATSGVKTAANVAGIDFNFGDGAYLAGIVAGANTKTNILGVIGGTELPPVVQAFKAFEAGARSVNPKIKVLTSYVGNWDDVSAAKEQALAQMGRGADMIFQNADNAGLGVFQAARERKTVRIFGSNSDQNTVAPEVTLGSVVIDLPHAFLTVAKEVRAKPFTGHVFHLGAKQDVVKWVPNPTLAKEITPATAALVDSIARGIRAGTFTVPQ